MKYDLFLFDLDDTLLNFKESERMSFFSALQGMGINSKLEELYQQYQVINNSLWKMFEQAQTSKEHLKVERFRRLFSDNKLDLNPEDASATYLDMLPKKVVLMDSAVETCKLLSQHGEIGIITNGIHHVQTQRIQNSEIAPYISFVSVSEECGYAKPDVRFFEYSAKRAKRFSKSSSLVIGDRFEADILGAHNFGVDSCWFNPHKNQATENLSPRFEIQHLSELHNLVLGKEKKGSLD